MEDRLFRDIEHLENILDGRSQPTGIKLSLLEYMTDDFSDRRVIGRGGFGVVYRGEFKNREVAVKKLTFRDNAEKDFDREVHNLMRVSHENIVQFLGYCDNRSGKYVNVANPGEIERFTTVYNEERIICFEYVSNGSLSDHIHDELRGLEWHTRYNIIKGICKALDYLHTIKKFVHRDLKPDNILIDNLMEPKIADLGISKLLHDGASKYMTTNAKATWEYAAPEFADRLVSPKYDIYSLGIIIIELVTGFRRDPDLKAVLTRWRHRWNKSDETLSYKQVAKCIEIGLSCQNQRPKKRPSISKIIKDMEDVDGGNGAPGQEIPCWNQLLWVEPAELFFPFVMNKQMSCSLELHNKADAYMAFFIKTDSDIQYDMDPKKGIIQPQSHRSVRITLLAQEEAPEKMWNSDEFTIKSKQVNEGLKADEITKECFSKKSGSIVDRVRVGVVFSAEQRAPCCISEEQEKDLSPQPLEISGSQELGETSFEAESIMQSVCDIDKKEIEYPSMQDTKEYTSSGADLKVIDEEPTIMPPNSDLHLLQSGRTHVEFNEDEPATESPTSDSHQLLSGSTHVEFSEAEPATESPTSDYSALRSHVQVNDEEPPISDDSSQHADEANPVDVGMDPGGVQLAVKYGETIPWEGALRQKVMLELTGVDYTTGRPCLDLILVVDVGRNMQGKCLDELKTAIRFVLQKLGPMDRLSIVIFSNDYSVVWPLGYITEASQLEVKEVIHNLATTYSGYSGGLKGGLLTGLKVLADRKVEGTPVAAIMLVSSCDIGYIDAEAIVSDVPVYSFAFYDSSKYTITDCRDVSKIAANSKGGTFSYIKKQDTGGLTMALSQCLAGLLTVSAQDLELTLGTIQLESKLLEVKASMRKYDDVVGSAVTIHFGHLYSREVRRVIVDLGLPAVDTSGEILSVTYSYRSCSSSDGALTVRNSRIVQKKNHDYVETGAGEIMMEENRLRIIEHMEGTRHVPTNRPYTWYEEEYLRAQGVKFYEEHIVVPGELRIVQSEGENKEMDPLLRFDILELLSLCKSVSSYKDYGVPYLLSTMSSHSQERYTARGDMEKIRIFATPRMDMYLEQAKKFCKDPDMRLPSADDDAKEELGRRFAIHVADDSSLRSDTTDDEKPAIASPVADDLTLRSSPTHLEANDEEPPISDGSSQHVVDEAIPGKEADGVQLVIKYGEKFRTREGTCKQTVLLEFRGGATTSVRRGLDLVALLDVGGECGIDEMKTAMRFVLKKLGPIDRLSIVIFSGDDDATVLCPLRQITEASRLQVEKVIDGLQDTGPQHPVDVNHGLQTSLKVLEDRKMKGVAAIMLVARREIKAAEVCFRNVPVHAFGYGAGDNMLLNEVASNSRGGSYCYVEDRYNGCLTMALSQCLAGLLTVVVRDFQLTVAPVQDDSTLLRVVHRMRIYTNKSGSPKIWFGNVYSGEVRTVFVDLSLPAPAVDSEDKDILIVTYLYNNKDSRIKDQQLCTCCRASAGGHQVTKVLRVRNSHTVQEETAEFELTGDRLQTPRMDMYLEQANKFYKDPTMSLPSADDDLKEELGDLITIDVASREAELNILRLDMEED